MKHSPSEGAVIVEQVERRARWIRMDGKSGNLVKSHASLVVVVENEDGQQLTDYESLADGRHQDHTDDKECAERQVTASFNIGTCLHARRGLIYIMVASLCYALLGVLVQLTTESVHELEAGIVRGVFLLVASTVGLVRNRLKLKSFSKDELVWITSLSFLNGLAQVAMFTAYSNTSVGDASAIIYSLPALSGVMAWIFIREPLTVKDVFITLVCILGVFLISKPTFLFGSDESEDSHFIGAVWAFVALVALSVACVITRKLRYASSNVFILTFGHGIVATFACVILNALIGDWSLPTDVPQFAYVIGIGLVGFFAIYFYNLSLQSEKALFISVLFTSTIFISYVFQFALFHHFPDVVSGAGILLLLVSIFAVFVPNWKTTLRNQENEDYNIIEQPTSL